MKHLVPLTLVLLSLLLIVGAAGAEPPAQEEEGQPYIVQPGDGLIMLARLLYGDEDAYQRIIDATNAMAAKDSSFRTISDANIILVGEKLWIPGDVDLAKLGAAVKAAAEAAVAQEKPMTEEEKPAAVEPVALAGTSWILTSLNGRTTLASTTVSLDFINGSQAGGTSGCNNYNTTYEVDGFHISFGPAAGTLKACGPLIMAQEKSYLEALADAAFFEATTERLRLFDEDTTMIAEFKPASNELAGSSWDVISYNNGKGGVVSVIIDTSLTAVFGTDGQLSGSAGCNNYFGPYTAEGVSISIGPLAATRKMCIDEDVMVQESAYLTALETAATYKITGDSMEMRREDGALVANFSRAE